MGDNRPTSQKIAHWTVATIGIVVLIVILIPVLCFGLFFFGGVAMKVDEAMDNAAKEVEKERTNTNRNSNARPANQSPR